jgi:hypothetical protein
MATGNRCTETVSVTPADLADDIENLRHMLGARVGSPKKEWGYRNHFATNADDASMLRLVALGLVRKGRGIPGGLVYFHATKLGCTIAGLDAKQAKRAME